MRPGQATDRSRSPVTDGGMVRMVVNHDAAVIDACGETWLPYVLQEADGRIARVGVIRSALLGAMSGRGDAPSGTTSRVLGLGEMADEK